MKPVLYRAGFTWRYTGDSRKPRTGTALLTLQSRVNF